MTVAALRTLLRLFSLLPLRWAHALGALLGALAGALPGRARATARANLRLCYPELETAKRERLRRASARELGKTVLELGAIWFWPMPRLEQYIEPGGGLEYVETAIARGKGLLVAVPHLGAWELMAPYWGRRLPLHTLYQPPRNPALEPLLVLARERAGGRVHPASPSGIKALSRALKAGEVVAILPDQKPDGRGEAAAFFGVPANTMTLLPRLAQRHPEAAVLLGYVERLPRGRGYRLHFMEAPEEVRDSDLSRAAAAMNLAVEQAVRRLPEQYQWTYKRFPRETYRQPPER
ncbi:lysophospholipid acyltransferase family protein [Alkalilimnicola sp. S0819]|uniref:lysophospholipid acyltransferase family protein n=1 Tax=Alkalilimnicola sp. S0819 TaxID=2613922 RepID=UPI001869A424|nr:lysophospholipid acyltransferase family protein [Alkalilimnicola sp. S0819]